MGVIAKGGEAMQACIDASTKCAQACYECFQLCLNEPDASKRTKCISMLLECAVMCQTSAALMAMGAEFAEQHGLIGGQLCRLCAKECVSFKDEHCQKCAEICDKTADEFIRLYDR
jgi:hypothetical protein